MRQTRPLAASLVITTLAFLVFALVVPGGIVIGTLERLPLSLLLGAAVVIGVARVAGWHRCGTTRRSSRAMDVRHRAGRRPARRRGSVS